MSWPTRPRRGRRHHQDPPMPLPRNTGSCRMRYPRLPRGHRSMDGGWLGHHRSREHFATPSSSQQALGSTHHRSQLSQARPTGASAAGVRHTSPITAPKQSSRTKARVLASKTRARARSRWCRSGKDVSTTPPSLTFRKELQS